MDGACSVGDGQNILVGSSTRDTLTGHGLENTRLQIRRFRILVIVRRKHADTGAVLTLGVKTLRTKTV